MSFMSELFLCHPLGYRPDASDVSEIEGEEEECEELLVDQDFVLGKDGETIWCTTAVANIGKTKKCNIVKRLPGRKQIARNVSSEGDGFLISLIKLISVEMIDEILMCAKMYITSFESNFARNRDCLQFNRAEIMILFGVLYLIRTKKSSHANVRELWASNGTGIPILRAAMSYNHFQFLLRCICCNDKATRNQRKEFVKLAPIRTILDSFVKNCIDSYNTYSSEKLMAITSGEKRKPNSSTLVSAHTPTPGTLIT